MATDENTFRRVDWSGGELGPADSDDDLEEFSAAPMGSPLTEADRKLLTLAARAFGAASVEIVDGENWVNLHFDDRAPVWNWNPLTHGDDALDLAVKLKLSIDIRENAVCVISRDGAHVVIENGIGSELSSVTRLGITRAAAEIAVAQAKKQA